MPTKHQMHCYRTINGVRWPNYCDILCDRMKNEVDVLRARGIRFRMIKHPEGFSQAFIHPEDVADAIGIPK